MKEREKEILKQVKEDVESAINFYDTHLKAKFDRLFKLYKGEKPDEKKYRLARSEFVSRDVLIAIHSIMPDLNRLMLNSKPIDIIGRNMGDDEVASKMEALLNYQIKEQNDFHLTFNRLVLRALITGCGILKIGWQRKEEYKTFQKRLSFNELLIFKEVEQNIDSLQVDFDGEVYNITYKKKVLVKNEPRIEAIANEEFLFDNKATSIENARFLAHRRKVSADFLLMKKKSCGFKNLNNIIGKVKPEDMAKNDIWLYEYWGKVDINNDGKPEDAIITYAKDNILSIQENTFKLYPFFIFCPIISPDSILGLGIAELAENTQLMKTCLIREILENSRYNNNRKIFYKVGDLVEPMQIVTDEQYVAVNSNADINKVFAYEPFETLSPHSFSLVEYFDKECQKATGANELKNGVVRSASQTATEATIAYTAANAQTQSIALNLADSLKKAYKFLVYQNQRFIDEKQVIRLLDREVEINPEDFKDIEFDLQISANFSTATEENRLLSLEKALQLMIEVGEPRGITDSSKIALLLAKILEEVGLHDYQKYLNT